MNQDIHYIRTLWIVPLVLNTILSLSSYWTGLIFSIDTLNHYARGSVFFLPTTVSMLYYGVVIYEILKNRAKVARPDTMILLLIFLLPIVCTIIQITFPHLLLIWPSVALSLLLYYVYSLELQYDYDIQSQIKNRTAFDKEMARCASNTDVAIFVFDLNNLKKINDTFGHSEGIQSMPPYRERMTPCMRIKPIIKPHLNAELPIIDKWSWLIFLWLQDVANHREIILFLVKYDTMK